MPLQRAPGVYYETTDPPRRGVVEVRTDVAGFVGIAARGPLHRPVRIASWTQFLTRFGGPIPEAFLGYAVKGFFANGGVDCWVVRAGVVPLSGARASVLLINAAGTPVFRLRARDHGLATERIRVQVEPGIDDRFSLIVEVDGEVREVWRDLQPTRYEVDSDGKRQQPTNRYICELIGKPDDQTGLIGLEDQFREIRQGSVLIDVEDLAENPDRIPRTRVEVRDRIPSRVRTVRPHVETLETPAGRGVVLDARRSDVTDTQAGYLGGETRAKSVLDGLRIEHLTGEDQPSEVFWGLKTLERINEIGIVAIPDLGWPGVEPPRARPSRRRPCGVLTSGTASPADAPDPVSEPRRGFSTEDMIRGQKSLLTHCGTMRDRFAILDAPAQLQPNDVRDWVNLRLGRSEAGQFGGLYYPWIAVPEPLPGPSVRLVPPSGHVAGVFARVDRSVGVQKPPANELIEEARGVEFELSPEVHGWLNDEGINVIRPYAGRGVRVMGARTLVAPGDPDLRAWRYVHVRRLLLMIEQSLDRMGAWLVFESNRPEKWREVDRVVRFYLDDLWRRGRLEGVTADEAYSVVCDESTNPDSEVNLGRMNCEIGVKPPDPAEFVIVRLGQRVGETGVVQFGSASDA